MVSIALLNTAGGDGYTSFSEAKVVISQECGCLLSTVLRRFLLGYKIVNQLSQKPLTPFSKKQKKIEDGASKWKVLRDCFQAKRGGLPKSDRKLPRISPEVDGRIVDVKNIHL
jgi:hypothetical protein